MLRFQLLAAVSVCFLFVSIGYTAEDVHSANAYQEFAARNSGDAERGKALFEGNKTQCADCHRITGMEKSGPNLDGIGDKYQKPELIRHVLDPSSVIMPGFEHSTVVMVDGRILSGRLERATKLGVRLIDTKGKQRNIKTEDIDEIKTSPKSLMPDNLIATIDRQEFADLISYLETLRFGIKNGLTAGGKKVPIPRLEKSIDFVRIHPADMRFKNPVWCGAIPGRPSEIAVVEHQEAKVWRLIRDAQPPRKELFLDLRSESFISPNQGLMCLAFHPKFESNGRYFLEHEVKEDGKVKTTIVERQASADRSRDSGRPSIRLIEVEQPAFNHNGGCIDFGHDGFLYAAFGDGGPQEDPNGYSQNASELLGSFIRIDVDQRENGRSYSIPPDNPFLEKTANNRVARPETWAIGFREPWRFSFDSLTGDLWVGDVGQTKFEEVSIVRKGENHGWNVREAFAGFSNEYAQADAKYTDPLFAYEHGLGFSVTGGFVYRADPKSSFYGVYIFGDYNTRRVWGLRQAEGKLKDVRELGTAPGGIASFGLDHHGEILLLTYNGEILHLDLSATTYE